MNLRSGHELSSPPQGDIQSRDSQYTVSRISVDNWNIFLSSENDYYTVTKN